MKVVINGCYGGFSLSALGSREYLKRKYKKAYFYRQTKYKHKNGVVEYTRIDNIEDADDLFVFVFTRDLGKKVSELPNDNDLWFSDGDLPRDDPDLVAVVEKFGEKADGQCAKLEIVEIPDGIQWEISEYDGNESVEEQHRSWR